MFAMEENKLELVFEDIEKLCALGDELCASEVLTQDKAFEIDRVSSNSAALESLYDGSGKSKQLVVALEAIDAGIIGAIIAGIAIVIAFIGKLLFGKGKGGGGGGDKSYSSQRDYINDYINNTDYSELFKTAQDRANEITSPAREAFFNSLNDRERAIICAKDFWSYSYEKAFVSGVSVVDTMCEGWGKLNSLRTDLLDAVKKHGADQIGDQVIDAFGKLKLETIMQSMSYSSMKVVNEEIKGAPVPNVDDVRRRLHVQDPVIFINTVDKICLKFTLSPTAATKLTSIFKDLEELKSKMETTTKDLEKEKEKKTADSSPEEVKCIQTIEKTFAKEVAEILKSTHEVVFAIKTYVGLQATALVVLKKVTKYFIDCAEALLSYKKEGMELTNRAGWQAELANAKERLKELTERIAAMTP